MRSVDDLSCAHHPGRGVSDLSRGASESCEQTLQNPSVESHQQHSVRDVDPDRCRK